MISVLPEIQLALESVLGGWVSAKHRCLDGHVSCRHDRSGTCRSNACRDGQPTGAISDAIERDFGNYERWKTEFTAIGMAEGGGSGWALLSWSPRDKRLMNCWAADHTTTLAGGRPILALDMYEHAYAIDYGAKAAAYVDAFMAAIRWDNAAALYERYR
jgi:superoxide dismutase